MGRRFHTIHNRLFLLLLCCMLILLLTLSGLYYKRSTDQYHAKVGEIAQKNMSQSVQLFDLLLKGYDSTSKSVSGNLDLLRLLSEPKTDPALHVINERTITNLLNTIYYSRDDSVGIYVMSYTTGTLYSYGNSFNVIDAQYMNKEWFDQIRQSTGEMVWLGVQPKSLIDLSANRPVFGFGRQLYEPFGHTPTGMVLIETDPKPILSGLAGLSFGPHSEVYLTSGDGKSMASTTAKTAFPAEAAVPVPADGNIVVDDRQSERLLVSAKTSVADWTIKSLTPAIDLNVELDQMKRYLVIVVSLMLIVATGIATFVSRTISSPLKRLIREMKQVEMGNFRGLLIVKSYEEIDILVSSFNKMVNRIDDLIERVKLSSISEKQAQLQALQSQVNPHFLYNTLDMIYWMLDEKENDRLGKVVLSLSHMFRYSSQWEGASEVALSEELEQIRHYLTIIEVRLEGRFTVLIDIENRWLPIRIPKMSLQPLIENAVKHGLERLERPGILRIYTQSVNGNLEIVIEENGVGMDEATLIRLRESLREGTLSVTRRLGDQAQEKSGEPGQGKTRRGIGLQNLQRRFVLMFGETYGIQVSSLLGKGTRFVVSIPLQPEGSLSHEYSHYG